MDYTSQNYFDRLDKRDDKDEVVAGPGRFITIDELRNKTHDMVIDYFKKNPNPTDDMIHDFAESMGMNHDSLENIIYKVLTKMIMKQPGKHNDVPDEEFDPEQLAMGIEIEKEHTDCPDIAKSIAKDHLNEIKNYYSRLKQMEEEAQAETNEDN